MKFSCIAIDTSRHVVTIHGVDEQERPVLRRELKRGQVERFFSKLSATEVVLGACGGSHHWARVLQGMGHQVRLIPPQYVKPFVKRSKNDRNDAEAISEAAAIEAHAGVILRTFEARRRMRTDSGGYTGATISGRWPSGSRSARARSASLIGSKTELLRTLTASAGGKSAAFGVRSFIRN